MGKDRLLCEQNNFESFTRGLGSASLQKKIRQKAQIVNCSFALFYNVLLSCVGKRMKVVFFPSEQSITVKYLIIIVTASATSDCTLTNFIF